MQVQSLVQEDSLEEEMATHSSILAWKISYIEEPGRLQSMGLQRVIHDLATEQQQQVFPGWVNGFHVARFQFACWKLIDLNTDCVETPTEPVSSSESCSKNWGPLLVNNFRFLDLLRWLFRKGVIKQPLCYLGVLLEVWPGDKERKLLL